MVVSKKLIFQRITHPVTLSSALMPSKPSSTSSISTFLRQARLPFRLVWLCCDGAPEAGLAPFFVGTFFVDFEYFVETFVDDMAVVARNPKSFGFRNYSKILARLLPNKCKL
jgi:hypothetical protein